MTGYKFAVLSEAASPITHGAGSAGNEALIVRHDVETAAGRVAVPGLNGNSLRSSTLRRPLADHLVRALELAGKLTEDLLYFLYAGGQGGSGAVVRPAVRERVRRLLPFADLLGGNLAGGQMMPGVACVSDGVLVCRENAAKLRGMLGLFPGLPGTTDFAALKPGSAFVGQWQAVKADPRVGRGELLHPDHRGKEAGYAGLPFGGECVAPGAVFYHDYLVATDRPEVAGAVAAGLTLWQAGGGRVGGGSARGRGRLTARVYCLGPAGELDPNDLVSAYLGHVAGRAGEAVAALAELYPLAPPDKTARKGKSRSKGEPAAASEGGDATDPG